MTEPRKVRVVCPECEGTGGYYDDDLVCHVCPVCNIALAVLHKWPVLDATLLPLADGPVVVEQEAWEQFVALWFMWIGLEDAQAKCRATWLAAGDDAESFDVAWEGAELDARYALTALFPAGIEVAHTAAGPCSRPSQPERVVGRVAAGGESGAAEPKEDE